MTISAVFTRLRALTRIRAARTAVVMVTTLAAMIATLILVVFNNLSTIHKTDLSVHQAAVIEIATADLLAATVDQEAGLAAYAESGGDDLAPLESYFNGRERFADILQVLSRLASDDPTQLARLEGVRQAMNQWRALYVVPQLSRAQSQVVDTDRTRKGREAMNEVRRLLGDVRSEEALITLAHERARERAYATARVTVVGVGLAALGFGAGLGLWAVRASARREQDAMAFATAKTQTLAIVSHEIRTPLNGMLGMLQVMASEPMTPTQKHRLEVALESGETMTALLNDLLDASKIEAGRLDLVETDFDLTQLLNRMDAVFSEAARKKGAALRIEFAPVASDHWIGDKVRIGQILTNLVSNAVKFTDQGEVKISVSAPAAGGLLIAVRDNGVGMDEAALDRLFAPYVQASATTSHTYGGTGLGLSISRSLARMMGGDIAVESAPGEGSCFTVSLPLRRGAAATGEVESLPSLASLRILAADDNPVNRMVLSAILANLGVEATVVEDGDQAVAAWRAGHYDLALLDLRMPVCDGFEAARRIRAEETSGRRIPLVLLSGDVSAQVREQGREAGLDGFVPKPLDVHTLIDTIAAALPPQRPPARPLAA